MLRYLAVFLTGFRVVTAISIPFFVFAAEDWRWAAAAVFFAAMSDPLDGKAARAWPNPPGHWANKYGKVMNDRASGLLSWTAPGSIFIWLVLNQLWTPTFWVWSAICAVFLLGTLGFEYHKRDVYGIDHRVRAEVLQGWFFALLLFVCCVQFTLWVTGTPEITTSSWVGLVLAWGMLGLVSSHRWTERNEVRMQHFAKQIVDGL